MSTIHFSTKCRNEAQKRFGDPKFNWLSKAAKEYILDNIGNDLRVQCPVMYPSPQIEFHGEEQRHHYDKIIELME